MSVFNAMFLLPLSEVFETGGGGGGFTKMLSALRVVLKVKIDLQNIEHEISLVDYTQCAASARDSVQCNNASQTARNLGFKHDPKCTYKIFVKYPLDL